MSEYIWRDCKKQPPLVDDGELVLIDSKDKPWVGFCKITPDGVFYFANNAEPLKNDFVKYARIEKLLALETELERTCKTLDRAKWWLNEIVESHRCTPISTAEMALAEITALEKSELENLEMLVNNVFK